MQRIGSYTTARVSGGRVERAEQHARRLGRDARRLGLTQPDLRVVEATLRESAHSAFGRSNGIVRVEWSALPGQDPELIATPRELGPDSDRWRVRISAIVHPGAETRHNTKAIEVEAYEAARAEVAEQGVDEVLLLDARDRLVEGARSNCVIVDSEGRLRTPALELGAVEGLGLSVLCANRPQIQFAEITRADLLEAREILCVNVVRGPVAVVKVGDETIGSGEPGGWARRLRAQFGRD